MATDERLYFVVSLSGRDAVHVGGDMATDEKLYFVVFQQHSAL